MRIALLLLLCIAVLPLCAQQKNDDNNWVDISNQYTKKLLKVSMEHNPVFGSRQGLAEYDERVPQPTMADEDHPMRQVAWFFSWP